MLHVDPFSPESKVDVGIDARGLTREVSSVDDMFH